MNMINVILQRVKLLFLSILGGVKRSFCWLRRRRKMSNDSVPLTDIGIVPNVSKTVPENENWDPWGENLHPSMVSAAPTTVQQHIDLYRQQTIQKLNAANVDTEPPVDFFQDMTPKISQQTKVLIKSKERVSTTENISSRLNFVPDLAMPVNGNELGDWEDSRSGWDEDEEMKKMLREKRRLERVAEQQKKRTEREHNRGLLGARIS